MPRIHAARAHARNTAELSSAALRQAQEREAVIRELLAASGTLLDLFNGRCLRTGASEAEAVACRKLRAAIARAKGMR